MQLPTITRVLNDRVERVLEIKEGTVTPLASKMKKIPMVIIPPKKVATAIQIMTVAHYRTIQKKINEDTIVTAAATKRIP
jgi:hypothetical protein